MGTKSVDKSSDSLTISKSGVVAAKRRRQVFLPPNQVQRGIYLYQRVAGSVYVRYRETTKKVAGVSVLVGDDFVDAGIAELIAALHESKNRK